jgi:hypothetical protein
VSERRCYRWASLVIDCDIPLPELTRLPGRRRADIVVRRALAPQRRGGPAGHRWRLPDGTSWASIASTGGEHVMRFRRFAEFVVFNRGRSIAWHAPPGTRAETVRHLLLDQVLPAVAFEHSLIGLHASAVIIGGAAIAFGGPAGRGKSTLAASFAVDGHAVVTDDCLMMEWRRPEPRAVPSYPSLRLWRRTAKRLLGRTPGLAPVAQYTSKLRIGARVAALRFRTRPVQVRRIYVIERRAGAARVFPLSRRQAYVELLKIAFCLDPVDRETARRGFAALSAIVQAVPVARLRLPLELDSLDDVRGAIAADLSGSPERTVHSR